MPTEIVPANPNHALSDAEIATIREFFREYDPVNIFPKIIAANEFAFLAHATEVKVTNNGKQETIMDYQWRRILDYPRLVLAILKKEYQQLCAQIREFKQDPLPFRENLAKLCLQRSTDRKNSFGFELFTESPANQLLCALVNYFFPEEARLAILLPQVSSFFCAELPELQKQRGMTAGAYRQAILNLTPVLVEKEPSHFTTADLPNFAFAGSVCFHIPSLLELSLNQQRNFYWFLKNKFPQLAESIYTHNSDISSMAASMKAELENAAPADMINLLIRELRSVGQSTSGRVFADISANRGFERFKEYLQSLPDTTRKQLEVLVDNSQSSGSTIADVIAHLNGGNCVESASNSLAGILQSNSDEPVLKEQPNKSLSMLKDREREYTNNMEKMSARKDFAKFPSLPKKLFKRAFDGVADVYIYIDLFKSLPVEDFTSLFDLYLLKIDDEKRLLRSLDKGLLDSFPEKKQQLLELYLNYYEGKTSGLIQLLETYIYESVALTTYVLEKYRDQCTALFTNPEMAVYILGKYAKNDNSLRHLLAFLPEKQRFTLLTTVVVPTRQSECFLADNLYINNFESMFAAIVHMPEFDALIGIAEPNGILPVDIKSIALKKGSIEFLRALLMTLAPEKLFQFLDSNMERVLKVLKKTDYLFYPILARLSPVDFDTLMGKYLSDNYNTLKHAIASSLPFSQKILPYITKDESIKLLKEQVRTCQYTLKNPWENDALFKAYLNKIPEAERYSVLTELNGIYTNLFFYLAQLPYFHDILELLPIGHRLSLLGRHIIGELKWTSAKTVLGVVFRDADFVKTFFTTYVDKESWPNWLESKYDDSLVLKDLMNYPQSLAVFLNLCTPDGVPEYVHKALMKKIMGSKNTFTFLQQLLRFLDDTAATELMSCLVDCNIDYKKCAHEELWKAYVEKIPAPKRLQELMKLKRWSAKTPFLDELQQKNTQLFFELLNLLPKADRLVVLGQNYYGTSRLGSLIKDSQFFNAFLEFTPQNEWENWLTKKGEGEHTPITLLFSSPKSLALLLAHFPSADPLPDYIRTGLVDVINNGSLPYTSYEMLKPYYTAAEKLEMLAAQPKNEKEPLWRRYSIVAYDSSNEVSFLANELISLLSELPENKRWPVLQGMCDETSSVLGLLTNYWFGTPLNIAPLLAVLPLEDAKAALNTPATSNGRTLAHLAIKNEEFTKVFLLKYCSINIETWLNPEEHSLRDDLHQILSGNKTLLLELLKLYPKNLPLWLKDFINLYILSKIPSDLSYLELVYTYLSADEIKKVFAKRDSSNEEVWKKIGEKGELLEKILNNIPVGQRYSQLLKHCQNHSTGIFFELLRSNPALFFRIFEPLLISDKYEILHNDHKQYGLLINLALSHKEFAVHFFTTCLTKTQLCNWISDNRSEPRHALFRTPFRSVLESLRKNPDSLEALFNLFPPTIPLPNILVFFVRELAVTAPAGNWQFYKYIFNYLSAQECLSVVSRTDSQGKAHWQRLIRNPQAVALFISKYMPEELWPKLSGLKTRDSSFMYLLFRENQAQFLEILQKMPKADQILALLCSTYNHKLLIGELLIVPDFFSRFFASDLNDTELLDLLQQRIDNRDNVFKTIYRWYPSVLKALLEARPLAQRMAILQLEKNWYNEIAHDNQEVILNSLSPEDKRSFVTTPNEIKQTLLHRAAVHHTLYSLVQAYFNEETLLLEDRKGSTVLHYAAKFDGVLTRLVADHPEFDWKVLLAKRNWKSGYSPFYLSCENSTTLKAILSVLDNEAVGTLLQAGTRDGSTALHLIVQKSECFTLIEGLYFDSALEQKDKFGRTPMHEAKKDILLKILAKVKENPDRVIALLSQRSNNCTTPFHELLRYTETVKKVLSFIPIDKCFDFLTGQGCYSEGFFELVIDAGADKVMEMALEALPADKRESALIANNRLEVLVKKLDFSRESNRKIFLSIIDQLSQDKLDHVWDMLGEDACQTLYNELYDDLFSLVTNNRLSVQMSGKFARMIEKLKDEPTKVKCQLLAYTVVLLNQSGNTNLSEANNRNVPEANNINVPEASNGKVPVPVQKYKDRVNNIPKLPTGVKVLCFLLAATVIGIVPAIIISSAYRASLFNRRIDICNKAEKMHIALSKSHA